MFPLACKHIGPQKMKNCTKKGVETVPLGGGYGNPKLQAVKKARAEEMWVVENAPTEGKFLGGPKNSLSKKKPQREKRGGEKKGGREKWGG